MMMKNFNFYIFICNIVIIVLLKLIQNVSTMQSGFYIDNGYNQTVMHRVLTKDDAQEVEHEILELLGLPDRPKKKHIHVSMRKSAPKFLLNVYKRLTEIENEDSSRIKRNTDETDNLITDIDKDAIDRCDVITTFINKHHHVSEVRHEHGRTLWFDVSEVDKDSKLIMGELRIYQNPELGKWKFSNKEFIITVYAITTTNGQRELEVLASVNSTATYHGWLEVNVTEGITKWLSNSQLNKGIYIGAHAVDKPEHEVKLDDIGLVNAKGDDAYQPFLVGFFSAPAIVKPVKHNSRVRRNAQRRRKKSDARNPLTEASSTMDPNYKSCKIQTLYVSFKDLNWQDWIIAPDGFGAFYCSGECNFPLNAHMNATNHAIVQTLVHLIQPSKVPKACCAPTKLSPISVLYFLDEANVNLKKYKNMVVKSCGCH